MSSVAYKLVYFLVVDAIVFVVTDGDGSAAGIVVSSLLAIFAVPYHVDFAFFFLLVLVFIYYFLRVCSRAIALAATHLCQPHLHDARLGGTHSTSSGWVA